ncbi:MarR family winged helix-turn-helix transcriptional regulator [Roseburia sp. 499]|uniref:MarR family winged helix-turn-helix transcriptional regulator n=1 Tax=Roseburia sp. 499 TaxID=1261634 RepID=UPI0009510BE0|nr:MarR family transcriptional regulator [Roseburia sp. 499]WVK69735.1 MarR family transcriptional regulator [Roseburia sp. 499]
MDSYNTIYEVLVKLFNEIMDIEEKAIITEEFKDISNNDMHIIEAIGKEEPKNMSAIAKRLSVTVGTLTIAINNLVKKGYVNRVRSEEDRRVVLISLSEKGEKAFDHHKRFHEEMVEATLQDLNGEETQVLVRALQNLSKFFKEYGK